METIREKTKSEINIDINGHHFWSNTLKRGIDIVFSCLGLILLWPFFLFVAVRIKQDDPGPVFYRGLRAGKGERNFRILKFRTMYERPESYQGARITANGDDRITPFGRWLRYTKLNELPQLWNVLVGDMSLVGPRPEDPEIFNNLPKYYREEILSVRPGITSPASISYHDEEHMLNAKNVMGEYLDFILPDKMRLDRLYIRHHSIISDFDTLFWTFIIMIPQIGKHKIPEGWLYGGPLSRFIRLYVNWFFIDFVIALSVITLMGVVWRLIKPLDVGVGPAIILGIGLAVAFSLSNTLFGLKNVSWQRAAAADVFKLFLSCTAVATLFIALQMVSPIKSGLSESFIITISVVVVAGFVVARYRTRLITGFATRWINFRKSGIGTGERALIIGAGHAGEFTAWMLRRQDFRPFYQVVGYVDDDPQKQGMRYDGIKVLGTTTDIDDLVRQHNVGLLFYAIGNAQAYDKDRILSICERTSLPMIFVPDVIEKIQGMFAESVRTPGYGVPKS